MKTFGSWTAVMVFLKAGKILRRHLWKVIFQYSSGFCPTFQIIHLSNSRRNAFHQPSNSFEKFKEPLPPYGDSWKNSITDATDDTPCDHQHTMNFYQEFVCWYLGDYPDFYLKADVLLLADILKQIRIVFLKVYTFDPSDLYSTPNMSWEPMLISTIVKLGLLQDVDFLFFERGVRGGMKEVKELRHFSAKNPHLNSFDPNRKTTFAVFFAVPSLYAATMQKKMPLRDHK